MSKKLNKQLAAATSADIAALYPIVMLLLEGEEAIVDAEHRDDLFVKLTQHCPSLAADVRTLQALGDEQVAVDAVRSALETLKNVDADLFTPSPPRAFYMRLITAALGIADVAHLQAKAAADSVSEKRRVAYALRKRLVASGKEVPTPRPDECEPVVYPAHGRAPHETRPEPPRRPLPPSNDLMGDRAHLRSPRIGGVS